MCAGNKKLKAILQKIIKQNFDQKKVATDSNPAPSVTTGA